MYTKKILSAATAVAIITTGVMAFDAAPDGTIVDSSYIDGVTANSDLNLSPDLRGDALVYPFYRHSDGWETEVIVRNTTENAIVAKAVIYSGDESDELIDFNIYLSPRDVFRFTMKDDNLYTNDGSITFQEMSPRYALQKKTLEFDQATFNPHWNGDEFKIITEQNNILSKYISSKKGYVVIYGMTEYPSTDANQLPYHKRHNDLWVDYRRLLDDCRPNWRYSFMPNGMAHGTMTTGSNEVHAPNVAANCGVNNGTGATNLGKDSNIGEANSILADDGYDLANFGDVGSTSLIGTVRVYNNSGNKEEARELLLPATALANFTDGNMLLWSDGEYANLADRRIEDGKYVEANIQNDAMNAFGISEAFYTFEKSDDPTSVIANNLIITQPLKGVLTDLEESSDDEHWTSSSNCHPRLAPSNGSTAGMGFYIYDVSVDEQENIGSSDFIPEFEHFTSPYIPTGIIPEKAFCDELQIITKDLIPNVDKIKSDDRFGYVMMNFSQGETTNQEDRNGIPAIVTQMVGSKVNGIVQTNWIYAPTIKK